MVVQHDHQITRPIDIIKLVNAMVMDNDINYVGFMSSSTSNICSELHKYKGLWNDMKHIVGNENIDCFHIKEYSKDKYNVSLLPLIFWYDVIHIANVMYYKTIFSRQHILTDQKGNTIRSLIL